MSEATPSYCVRHSFRARRASIRILPGRGVEVVLPQGVSPDKARDLVLAKAGWIRKTLRKLDMQQQRGPLLPQSIRLGIIGRSWDVRYSKSSQGSLRLLENADCLQFLGRPHDDEGESRHCGLLKRWLKDTARSLLVPLVRELEQETSLGCRAVQVRLQRTRWGSCSSRKTLSLNASLVFLPPELVRYVLLHELCHTQHMDHSPRFWLLLEQVQPGARTLDRRLNRAWSHVPAWVLQD